MKNFLTLILLVSLQVSAAPKKKKASVLPLPEKKVSLRDTALEESKVLSDAGVGAPQAASDAQVMNNDAGVLKLQDTYRPKYTRQWIWNLGVRAESYQPKGTGEIKTVSTYDFSEAGRTIIPSLSLGILSKDSTFAGSQAQLGLEADLGYANQKMSLVTPTNVIIEAQLQTFRMSVAPTLRYQWTSLDKIHTLVKAFYGQSQLYQTSQNTLARQTKTTNFTGYTLGLEYELRPDLGVSLDYTDRQGLSQEIIVTSSSLGLGATYRW